MKTVPSLVVIRSLIMLVLIMPAPGVIADESEALKLRGAIIQGGVIRAQAQPGATVTLDGNALPVSNDGHFLFGFNRDDQAKHALIVELPDGRTLTRVLTPRAREYDIEHVDGVPPATVEPPAEVLERIRREAAQVGAARKRRDARIDWLHFVWPAKGRISGVYGSQRVLNGKPSRPHYGVDVAAPTGTPVTAPAPGLVTLAEADLYFSGGTIIIDHGHGLTSTFLHLSKVVAQSGDYVDQGQLIGHIGATGRASGPHLDWRMNWRKARVDPQTLVPAMAAAPLKENTE